MGFILGIGNALFRRQITLKHDQDHILRGYICAHLCYGNDDRCQYQDQPIIAF